MARYHGLTAKVGPRVDLHTITISLHPFQDPTVTLNGKVKTGNRRVDASTEVAITTMALGDRGAAFIREMKDMFAPPSEADEK